MNARPASLVACLVALLAVPSTQQPDRAPQRPAQPTVITKHFTPADRAAGRYQYVPFDVPAGVHRLRIGYAYTREGGNTVDLGLFEPGPLTFGTAAFRGWSGGERDRIEIGERWSSPGYRVGPLPSGQWNIALGLYRLGEAGVDVTVTVELDPPGAPSPPQPTFPSPTREVRRPEGDAPKSDRWWHGDLHVHTEHSDGKHSVEEVARLAAASGLDFIIIADHDNTTHRRDLDDIRAPLIISGEEVTTPGGHANVWGPGPDDWFDFRLLPGDPHLADVVEGAHAHGALFSINHPFLSCDQCSWTHPVPSSLDAIEVWNGPTGPQPEAVKMWDGLLKTGRRVTGVASSDWHRPPAPMGAGSVRVLAASLSQSALLESIRKGHVVMMRDAAAPAPRVTARSGRHRSGIGDTLESGGGQPVVIDVDAERFVSPGLAGCPAACRAELYVDGERTETRAFESGHASFAIEAPRSGYARIQITSGDAVVALTNPIWLQVR